MSRVNVDILMAQIDKIQHEYGQLRQKSRYDDLSDLRVESDSYVVRLRAAIERLAPDPSTYMAEMRAVASDKNNSTAAKIRIYMGILTALRADLADGWLENVTELLHADTFDDFLSQSTELFGKGYQNAAAVVAGSTLEAHIRLLCKKRGINTTLSSGQTMSADRINAELVKASAYNSLQQKAVASWQAIRNAAAHGEYDKYSKEQVANMISAVRDFMLHYPA